MSASRDTTLRRCLLVAMPTHGANLTFSTTPIPRLSLTLHAINASTSGPKVLACTCQFNEITTQSCQALAALVVAAPFGALSLVAACSGLHKVECSKYGRLAMATFLLPPTSSILGLNNPQRRPMIMLVLPFDIACFVVDIACFAELAKLHLRLQQLLAIQKQ